MTGPPIDPLDALKMMKARQSEPDPLEQLKALGRPAPKPPTTVQKIGATIGQGASMGFGAKILGGLDALNHVAPKAIGGDDAPLSEFGSQYIKTRDRIRGANQDLIDEHPISGRALELASGVATSLPAFAGRAVVSAPSMFARMLAGAKTGAGVGAVAGAGNATGDVGDYARGMATGATTGAVLGGALPPIASGVGKVGGKAVTALGLRPSGRTAAELAEDAATMRAPLGPQAGAANMPLMEAAAGTRAPLPPRTSPAPTTGDRVRATFGSGVEKLGVESAKTRALRELGRRFELDNVAPGDALSYAEQNASKPLAVLDLGDGNVSGLARTAKDVPGLGRRLIPKLLHDRSSGNDGATLARVTQDIENRIGLKPEDYYKSVDDMTKEMKTTAKTNYDKVRNTVVDDPEVLSLFDEPEFQSIHERLRANARLGGKEKIAPLSTTEEVGGEKIRTLNPQTLGTLDKVKRQLDKIVAGKSEAVGTVDRDLAYNMRTRVNDILDRMDELHPDYGKARAQYRGSAEAIDAVEQGKTDFATQDPRLTTKKLAEMPERLRDLYRRGQYDALRVRLSKMDDGSNIGAFLEKNPDIRERVAALAKSPEEAASLRGDLGVERSMGDRKNQILGGPNTAERIIEHGETAPRVAGMEHGMWSIARHALKSGYNRAVHEETANVMGEVGKLMTRTGPSGVRLTLDELAALRAADAQRALGSATRGGVVSGSVGGARARRPLPPRN